MNYQQSYQNYPAGYGHLPPTVRPATVTAAAVVGFVASAFELIGGFVWLLGGSVIGDIEQTTENLGGENNGVGAIIMLLAVLSLITAAVYIWGGVITLGGKRHAVLLSAAVAAALINLVALIATGGAGAIGLILAVVVASLLLAPASRARR